MNRVFFIARDTRCQGLCLIICWLTCCNTFAQTQSEPVIALVGGMLIDGYDAPPVHHAAVIIQGDRILAAAPRDQMEIPANAHVIDTRGKTMMPGLIDLHAHTEIIGHGEYEEYWRFVDTPERLAEMRRIAVKQLLRAGVTSAADLGSTLDILETRRQIDAGEIPGPRLIIAGPQITRFAPPFGGEGSHRIIETPQQAARAAEELIDSGVDIVKIWFGMDEADMRAVVDAAHARGVMVHAHLYEPERIRAAVNAGVDVLQHVGSGRNPPYDEDLVLEIAHRNIPIVQTIAHRIWVYPATLAFPERLESPLLREDLSAELYDEFQRSFDQFHRRSYFREIEREIQLSRVASRQFIEAGAVIGVGTDGGSPMNFHTEALWWELFALVDSGMTPRQVISAATKTNAEILSGRGGRFGIGAVREFGTVEAGMLADIIVLAGDPLSDIHALRHVDLVIKNGVPWYTEQKATDTLRMIGRAF